MDKETEILNFIKEFVKEHGWAPTYNEIIEGTSLSSTSHVHYWLGKMESQHLIEHKPGSPRAIRVL